MFNIVADTKAREAAAALSALHAPVRRKLTVRELRRGSFSLLGKKKVKDEKGEKFLSIKQERGANSVNPFLTRMFFRISFQSWRSVTKRLH